MNAQQMGTTLLDQAREAGTQTLIPASLRAVHCNAAGGVEGVSITSGKGSEVERITCGAVINCAGPYAAAVNETLRNTAERSSSAAALAATAADGEMGVLPLRNEVHAKAVLKDSLGIVPAEAPMVIWQDEIELEWSEEEAAELRAMGDFEASLTRPLAAGAHLRPYPGSPVSLLMLWEALHCDLEPGSPPHLETPMLRGGLYAELVIRGLQKVVPRLAEYLAEDGSLQASFSVDYHAARIVPHKAIV